MEEGEVQIFFLTATIISFLSRNSSARQIKIIEPGGGGGVGGGGGEATSHPFS